MSCWTGHKCLVTELLQKICTIRAASVCPHMPVVLQGSCLLFSVIAAVAAWPTRRLRFWSWKPSTRGLLVLHGSYHLSRDMRRHCVPYILIVITLWLCPAIMLHRPSQCIEHIEKKCRFFWTDDVVIRWKAAGVIYRQSRSRGLFHGGMVSRCLLFSTYRVAWSALGRKSRYERISFNQRWLRSPCGITYSHKVPYKHSSFSETWSMCVHYNLEQSGHQLSLWLRTRKLCRPKHDVLEQKKLFAWQMMCAQSLHLCKVFDVLLLICWSYHAGTVVTCLKFLVTWCFGGMQEQLLCDAHWRIIIICLWLHTFLCYWFLFRDCVSGL